MLRSHLPIIVAIASILCGCGSTRQAGQREFSFCYAATITGLAPGALARIWLPIAQNDRHQQVEIDALDVPGEPRFTVERRYGNRLLYTEARADAEGCIPLSVVYSVRRSEVLPGTGAQLDHNQRHLFMQANAMVPMGSKEVSQLVGDHTGGVDPRELYDLVDEQVSYSKPDGGDWGRGDALWVCESGHGNCTDFHSLFIALCRDSGIPARFEMGFSLPPHADSGPVSGYHCWAWFDSDGRWSACDISEADKVPELKEYFYGHLTPDRFALTTGRDLALVPAQDGPPLNYLIYPYVEVNGAVHTGIEKHLSFRDR